MIKNLKSLFIVQEEDEETNKGEEEGKVEKDVSSKETTEENPFLEDINSPQALLNELGQLDDFDEKLAAALEGEIIDENGNVDNAIIEELLAVVEKNNIKDFDYFEYKQSLKALEKMPMDEATKYRSAFATASTIGVTLQTLLDSAKFYIDILDGEEKKKNSVFDKEMRNTIGNKEKEMVKLETSIEDKTKQIKKLKKEIEAHKTKISELKHEIKIDKVDITKAQNNFNASFEYLKTQFTTDITKMKKYLK